MKKVVVSVENLSKRYDLGVIGTGTVSKDLNRWWAKVRHRPDPYTIIGEVDHGNREGQSILALNDVSFTVEQGEVLGIIGRNGAGKSTLLKILSQVTAPSDGRVKIKGRIGSLLEVGTGFHPELTGRENIFLNGAILGMSRTEVSKKFDEIVDFSGVEKFVDTPVKRYSSGMYVRLAFAVAAHLEPEILIVDEVLAVGDAEFQKKCLGKMSDVAKGGRTVLFVSHNMGAVNSLCTRAILLESGMRTLDGKVSDVTMSYLDRNEQINQVLSEQVTGNGFHLIELEDREGNPKRKFLRDDSIYIRFKYNLIEDVPGLYITFSLSTIDGFKLMFEDIQESSEIEYLPKNKGNHEIIARIPEKILGHGEFYFSAGMSQKMVGPLDVKHDYLQFEVARLDTFRNSRNRPPINPNVDWKIIS